MFGVWNFKLNALNLFSILNFIKTFSLYIVIDLVERSTRVSKGYPNFWWPSKHMLKI